MSIKLFDWGQPCYYVTLSKYLCSPKISFLNCSGLTFSRKVRFDNQIHIYNKIKCLTFVASTSVAICDESPLLQSIGLTVIKENIL
jgi:hypothetical protein